MFDQLSTSSYTTIAFTGGSSWDYVCFKKSSDNKTIYWYDENYYASGTNGPYKYYYIAFL